jgi:CDP-glycerol glycerophosphotransferase (TagB/SpsB family)
MEMDFEESRNMNLDREADYHVTFFTSDILVSDTSSMMLEYFGTGKPIVYTHRIDVFNELGRKLAEGFYWVNNATELKATLEMLISGNDPLRDKRKELAAEVLFLPKEGSGSYIRKLIREDFYENVYNSI